MQGLLAFAATLALAAPGIGASADARLRTASEAIQAAVIDRMGAGVAVTVDVTDPAGGAAVFLDAAPDPVARLGRPVRFTLKDAAGGRVAVTASLSVVAPHLVARRAIGRGHAVTAADVEEIRAELNGTPILRVPTGGEVIGTRALRPIATGAVILPADVALRRAVEQGDRVTVVALVGNIEVTATCVAADGGRIGDVIRVRNPGSQKYLRGRIVRAGVIEVMHER